ALALTQRKVAGSIAIITEESELPYERPPLSKEYLAGDKPWERMLIRRRNYGRNAASPCCWGSA
ncbi:hypothetical protein ACEV8Z_23965, partial [Vibrio parahaemolyticus]